MIAKVISLSVSFITVPLTLNYLGMERFGIWMTLSSMIAMFSFADLGMSNGLINLVAEANGREDRQAIRNAVASAFWMLLFVALLIVTLIVGIYHYVPWPQIFNVHSPLAIAEAGPVSFATILCFAVSLPLATVASLQSGQQSGLITNIWNAVGSLVSLGAILVAIHLHASLPLLVVAIFGVPVFISLLNAAKTFLWDQRWLFPSLLFFSRPIAILLLRTGLMFFCLQLAAAIGYQSDNLVIAHLLGATHVGSYAVPSRLFNVLPFLIGIITGPMWPAYADALSRGDHDWIRKTFRRTVIWTGGGTLLLTGLLVVFSNYIFALWVGPGLHVSRLLLVTFGVRCVLSSYLQPLSFFLNGIGKLKEQAVISLLMAGFNLALSIVLVEHVGIIGAILSTVVAEILIVLIPETLIARRALHHLSTPIVEKG
ncbi:oligosaccharide flippase family protein [Terriglobus saanensis]|nr:oligosaccharide flippase family protein [Terriglobus saanensis]